MMLAVTAEEARVLDEVLDGKLREMRLEIAQAPTIARIAAICAIATITWSACASLAAAMDE